MSLTGYALALKIVLPIVLGFVMCAILTKILIPQLIKLKVSNTEREELTAHHGKAGTPSMGGIAIILSVVAVTLIFIVVDKSSIPIMLVMVGFGVIGFLDDILKTVKKNSDGLIAWQKFLLQIVVTALFFIYVWRTGVSLGIILPFTTSVLYMGWLAIPLLFILMIGTVNGVNFTDGVDGLVSSVTIVVALFFMIVSLNTGGEHVAVIGAVIGALMGFLVFNLHPAKIFMGDTGSLALGGFVAAYCYLHQMPVIMVIVGLIYWIEVLSVMIQVGYFKMTGGKRVFRMAPIHHHFELGGWSETKVVGMFTIFTFLMCAFGFIAIGGYIL